MFCKNLCDKVSKNKNWRLPSCLFFRALHRGVLCFFCRSIFHGENCETKSAVLTTNSSFYIFSKKSKQEILFHIFLHEKCINRKNKVHHDEEHGKTNKMFISNFQFLKLCHGDFCKTFSEIFNFLKK